MAHFRQLPLRRPNRHFGESGSTLIEAVIASVLVAMVLGSLAATNSLCLGLVKAHREGIAAGELMEERLEQFRGGRWTQVTTASGIRDDILSVEAAPEGDLTNCRETVTVAVYPPLDPPSTPIVVERRNGVVTIISEPAAGNVSMRQALAVRVDVRVRWKSRQHGGPRSMETSSVVAIGGLLR